MGMFGKGSGDAPPDIGQEEKYDEEKGFTSESDEVADEKLGKIKMKGNAPPKTVRKEKSEDSVEVKSVSGLSNMQVESINARIDSVVEWIKQFYERFSYVSESIGEIRTMTMNNEKRISEAMKEADKVIDVVKEVKPEELRIDYQKSDMKMTALAEKIEANKLFMDEVMKEMNDLRRKSEVFIGTEGLMKLNNDTKKDLVEMQKINSKTRMQADKAQEIFMELRKGFADSQKVGAIVENLDESYAGIRGEIESLKLDYGEVVKRSDYLDFKKTYGNKLALFDASIFDIENIKKSLNEMGDLVETSLAVSRRNEEDIGEVGMKIGANEVKRVSDYENQMMEIVGIIETLSKQLTEVRKKVGLKVGKEVEIKKVVKPSTGEEVVEKVAGVKVAGVPRLKPEEFLGKKNIIEKEGEENLEKVERKIRESEPRKKMKEEVNVVEPRAGIRGMLKKIVAKKKPEVKSEIKKKENVKKIKKKFWKRKIKKKKDTGKKNNHEERAEKKKAKK